MPDKKLIDDISRWVDAHREDLIRDTARLVSIKSVRGEALPDAPFGLEPRRALDEAVAMCNEYGFKTEIHGGAVGTADMNDNPAGLDILGHLDVVGEGPGWDTDPYVCVERDGCLYGRGTDDDKGPIAAALLAMRCVRELGVPLVKNVRLIMGTDEESGSGDLPYYYKNHAPAPMTFTPDSGFPVYNVEKGGYKPLISMDWPEEDVSPRVDSIDAGFRINVIPSDASAVVAGMDAGTLKSLASPLAESFGVTADVADVPGGASITVHGKQAHAAMPEEGVNGLTALLSILAALPLADCKSTRAIRALAEALPHGDYLGKAMGIAREDELSGPLTVSFTLLSVTKTGLRAQLDSRVSVSANEENCRQVVEKRLGAAGFKVEGAMQAPHHTDGEGIFVQTLLRCYETYSGRKGECLSMGGGTYVHDIPGGVAFGASMPDFDTRLHGANERMSIADTLSAVKIFALAIAELCAGDVE